MLELLTAVLTLIPFEAPPGVPGEGVQPASPGGRGNGFAAYILGGYFGLALLMLAMVFISMKPKRSDPRDIPPPRPRPR